MKKTKLRTVALFYGFTLYFIQLVAFLKKNSNANTQTLFCLKKAVTRIMSIRLTEIDMMADLNPKSAHPQ